MKYTFPIEIIVVKIPYIHGNCIHCKCKLKCWLNREFNKKNTIFNIKWNGRILFWNIKQAFFKAWIAHSMKIERISYWIEGDKIVSMKPTYTIQHWREWFPLQIPFVRKNENSYAWQVYYYQNIHNTASDKTFKRNQHFQVKSRIL